MRRSDRRDHDGRGCTGDLGCHRRVRLLPLHHVVAARRRDPAPPRPAVNGQAAAAVLPSTLVFSHLLMAAVGLVIWIGYLGQDIRGVDLSSRAQDCDQCPARDPEEIGHYAGLKLAS